MLTFGNSTVAFSLSSCNDRVTSREGSGVGSKYGEVCTKANGVGSLTKAREGRSTVDWYLNLFQVEFFSPFKHRLHFLIQ